MGPPKGSKNAKAYHDANIEKRTNEIRKVLKDIRSTGVLFQNVTSLSAFVAEKVGTAPYSLRRNRTYRALLEHHLGNQKGAATLVSDRDRQTSILKAKLKTAQLEASNLRADKNRLIAALERAGTKQIASDNNADVHPAETEDFRASFECTAQVLWTIMEELGGLKVDFENEVILDMAARPSPQPIAGANQCRPFVNWHKEQKKRDAS